MNRITVTLTERVVRRLEREARRRLTSVSAVVRECIASSFPDTADGDGPRHIPFTGVGASTTGPYGADVDNYLAGWKESIESHRE